MQDTTENKESTYQEIRKRWRAEEPSNPEVAIQGIVATAEYFHYPSEGMLILYKDGRVVFRDRKKQTKDVEFLAHSIKNLNLGIGGTGSYFRFTLNDGRKYTFSKGSAQLNGDSYFDKDKDIMVIHDDVTLATNPELVEEARRNNVDLDDYEAPSPDWESAFRQFVTDDKIIKANPARGRRIMAVSILVLIGVFVALVLFLNNLPTAP